MKLLWAQDYFWPDMRGGGGRRAYYLVKFLSRLGNEIEVLTRQTVPTGIEHATLDGIPIHRFNTPEISDAFWRIRAGLRQRQWKALCSRFLRDRVFEGAIVFGAEIAYYLRRTDPGMKIVIATGGTWFGAKSYTFDRPASSLSMRIAGQMSFAQYYLFERLGYRAANYVVAESENVREQLARLYHMPTARVPVIGNGVDHELFRPRPGQRNQIRRKEGWPDDAFLVIGVGRLSRVKNYDYLIRSVALAAKEIDIHGVIVGEGDQRNALASLAEELGIGARIHLIGQRSDVPELLSACDAFLLPSLFEAYGNAWVEALATGLPCMGLKREFGRVNSAAGEHITHGVTGYLLEADQPEQCAARLAELASCPERVRQMGEEARRIALQKYDWEKSARQYAALFR